MSVIVVYDTETTGVNPESTDEIVQFASVLSRQGEDACYEWQALANPGRPIPTEASAVHGITDEHVANARPAVDVVREWWREVQLFADGEPIILAGHNTGFDYRFIKKHINPKLAGQICTMQMARRLLPHAENHKLEPLFNHLGLSLGIELKAHDAMSDVWMCFALLRQMMADNEETEYMNVVGWLEEPKVLDVIPFGKWKGFNPRDVPRSYASYMLGKDLDPDMKATLQWVMNAA